MSTHNLCFEQKYEKYQNFYLKTFSFLVVKFSIYLNRRIFILLSTDNLYMYVHGELRKIIFRIHTPYLALCAKSRYIHAEPLIFTERC